MRKHHNNRTKALIFSGLSFALSVAHCQQGDSIAQVIDLESVTVNALSLPSNSFEFPGALASISNDQLGIADQSLLTAELNQIPGAFMHSGALNTNRITIRGIGSRTPFATNKIRAFYGHIPLTDGGGETTIEDIDLSLIGSIEVQKGPNASNFGSGLGGTLIIEPSSDSNALMLHGGIGSFGLIRSGVNFSLNENGTFLRMGFSSQRTDGYRENNQVNRTNYFLNWKKDTNMGETGFLVLHTDQKAFIPSSLSITDYHNNPERAAFTWGQAKGFEDYSKTIFGVQGVEQLSDGYRMEYAVYALARNNDEPRPFNILEDRVFGGGSRLMGVSVRDRLEWSWVFEGYSDEYRFKTYENLYEDFPNQGSIRGDQLSDDEERRSFINYGFSGRYRLSDKTNLEAGVNLNRTWYRFNGESKTFDFLISPKFSLTHSITPDLITYLTVSHGFTPPSPEETLNESGGFNLEIQPETGWNREVGLKGNFRRITFTLATFSIDIQDLLVTRRTAEDVTYGINAGSTIHEGVEFEIDGLVFSSGRKQLTVQGSYSLNRFRFNEFVDDEEDYSGNELTGVPGSQAAASLDSRWGLVRAGIEYQFIDEMPITDDNSLYSENYELVNAYVGLSMTLKKWTLFSTLRVMNMGDEKYASMFNINAQAFGGGEPRYFYPGLPRNWQINFSLKYHL